MDDPVTPREASTFSVAIAEANACGEGGRELTLSVGSYARSADADLRLSVGSYTESVDADLRLSFKGLDVMSRWSPSSALCEA